MFVKHLGRPEQYKKYIVQSNDKGDILHLEDIAKIEFVPAKP
jgi:hypothetical protein